MLLKSLLALLLTGAASVPPPLPRLRGTAPRNSSDVNEGTSPDDIIERAVPCPLIYLPVCCGGVTYANACVAGERQCDDGACSTPARSGGYDEHEDQDEPAARAAVSNHSTRIKNPCRSRRVSSDEPKPGSRFQRRAKVFTTGRRPHRQDAPSRIRNLAHSAALVPPWRPNATSGLIDAP